MRGVCPQDRKLTRKLQVAPSSVFQCERRLSLQSASAALHSFSESEF
jgi:hypothetical protein